MFVKVYYGPHFGMFNLTGLFLPAIQHSALSSLSNSPQCPFIWKITATGWRGCLFIPAFSLIAVDYRGVTFWHRHTVVAILFY